MTTSSLNSRTTLLILVASVALLFGATGGAVADGLITSKDIRNGTVSTKDIRGGTIKTEDFAPSAAARVSGYEIVDRSVDAAANQQNLTVEAFCHSGRNVLGASGYWMVDDEAVQVFINGDGRGATAYGDNPSASVADVMHVRIVCGRVSTQSSGGRVAVPSTK